MKPPEFERHRILDGTFCHETERQRHWHADNPEAYGP